MPAHSCTTLPQVPPLHSHPPPPHSQPPKSTTMPLNKPPELSNPLHTGKSQLLPPERRTGPLIWCAAVVCVVLTLLLILAGIVTLIVFFVIRPRSPSIDLTTASLNSIYLDSPTYLNGDVAFLANFSNPNHKIDVVFKSLGLELYFRDRLIAVQALRPFALRTGESRLEAVRMITSEVLLPAELAEELQKQVRENSVVYSVRGSFKVRARFGAGHYSYWIYNRCDVKITAPPNGVLVARRCRKD
ncbi:NDR1/HIN1-like protein 13 [Zingiber officinale]|uniref:Late embryogenesis abundant protein LEA-2 subgroup domain-containing protein n=1 Tax=Zingiber officinale TaxID=94328 RepID=A0A8J5C6P7_ZINOF|nr:NDR1/HIN1-like protein 13 [Zingiber officinale]KAG6469237.1 hypothetical protein ZIOFF_073943 [Zingiber officinale]